MEKNVPDHETGHVYGGKEKKRQKTLPVPKSAKSYQAD